MNIPTRWSVVQSRRNVRNRGPFPSWHKYIHNFPFSLATSATQALNSTNVSNEQRTHFHNILLQKSQATPESGRIRAKANSTARTRSHPHACGRKKKFFGRINSPICWIYHRAFRLFSMSLFENKTTNNILIVFFCSSVPICRGVGVSLYCFIFFCELWRDPHSTECKRFQFQS